MRRRWVLVLLAMLFAVAFVALADVAEDQQLLVADPAARALVQSERGPALEPLMRQVTRLGSGRLLVPLNGAALLLLWRRARRLALFVPSATAGAVLFEGLAKWLIGRPRPNLSHYGFPSGHTLAAVVFFGALAYVVWTLVPRRAWLWTSGTGAALVVLGVGFSRLYLDAHWLSDVLGGLTGGMAYLLLGIAAFETLGSRPEGQPL